MMSIEVKICKLVSMVDARNENLKHNEVSQGPTTPEVTAEPPWDSNRSGAVEFVTDSYQRSIAAHRDVEYIQSYLRDEEAGFTASDLEKSVGVACILDKLAKSAANAACAADYSTEPVRDDIPIKSVFLPFTRNPVVETLSCLGYSFKGTTSRSPVTCQITVPEESEKQLFEAYSSGARAYKFSFCDFTPCDTGIFHPDLQRALEMLGWKSTIQDRAVSYERCGTSVALSYEVKDPTVFEIFLAFYAGYHYLEDGPIFRLHRPIKS